MRVLCINDKGWRRNNGPFRGPRYMEECMVIGDRSGRDDPENKYYILAEYYFVNSFSKVPYAYAAEYFIPLEGFDPQGEEEIERELETIKQQL